MLASEHHPDPGTLRLQALPAGQSLRGRIVGVGWMIWVGWMLQAGWTLAWGEALEAKVAGLGGPDSIRRLQGGKGNAVEPDPGGEETKTDGANVSGSGKDCPPEGELAVEFAGMADGPVPAGMLGIVEVTSPAEIRDGLLVTMPPVELGNGDAGVMAIRFACARGKVTLDVVNTGKSGSVLAQAWAYSGNDGTKPVARAEVLVPAAGGQAVPLTLCRPLDEDIALVVLDMAGATPEAVRSVVHGTRKQHQVRRLDFEDREVGELVWAQYPGVVFVDRPIVVAGNLSAIGKGEGDRMLSKVPSDQDSGPMILRFDPPQAEVRVRVGYPVSEDDGRPLRITMSAYGGAKGEAGPIATDEALIPSPRVFDRILGVARCESDIHEVRIHFVDRVLGGIEVIDDLEFGPEPTRVTEPDTTPPVVRVVSPGSGAWLDQISPAQSIGGTNLVVEIDEAVALNRIWVVVRDEAGAEFRRLDDSLMRVTGSAPRYRVEATIPLAYGRNTVEVRAADTAGNEGTDAAGPLVLFYQGPAPLGLQETLPDVGYPEDVVSDPDPVQPEAFRGIRLPSTVFTLRGTNMHPLVRVYAVREEQSQVPPRQESLIAAEIVSRNEQGTELQVRLPGSVWAGVDASTDVRLRWILEDAWTRPDRIPWVEGGRLVARQRPWPMTHGFGFVNEEGPNTLTDFDGVFRLNAYLSWTDHCWRDPIYLGFYEWGYSVTLNRSPGGSCFGLVGASQALYTGDFDPNWLNRGFYEAVRFAAGRYRTGEIRESNPGCGPRSPGSLWSWIQTFHGMQQSEEHLYQQLDQIVRRGGMWRGNLAARLAQLRTRPYAYMLCLKPNSGTTGHCVLPYRLETLDSGITRIWVYDPNYPYNHYRPEDHPANVRSLYSYVDVDPVANHYEFDVEASYNTNDVALVRNHYHAGLRWSGQGLTVTQLPIGNRTMPGIGYGLDYIFSTVSGDARPQYTNPAGERWGWGADGKRVEAMDDVHPFTPFTYAGVESDQVTLLSRGSNAWSKVHIHAQGTNYQFVTGGGGVLVGVRNSGAIPGAVDVAEQEFSGGSLRAVRFIAEQPNGKLEPFVVVPESPDHPIGRVLWRWQGLQLPAGSPLVLEADRATGGVGARNEGRAAITARLIRERGGDGGNGSIDYGMLTLPPGGAIRLTPSGPVEAPRLREEWDLNGDGVVDRSVDHDPALVGERPRLLPIRADGVKRRIRLRIQGVVRDDVVVERSDDMIGWKEFPAEPAVDDPAEFEGPLESGSTFFRLRRLR